MSSPSSATVAIAELVAAGDLANAAQVVKLTLEAEPGMRSTARLSRLHREVIQHKGTLARLGQDLAAGRIGREVEHAERARLTAALLDMLDEMARAESELGLAFRVEMPAPAPQTQQSPKGPSVRDEPSKVDVFLSYARPDRALIVDLAVALEARGCGCWFDHFVAGGARFRDAINARLDAALAVVVLWSEHAVRSDWVIYEADRAHKAGKLIPLRMPALALDKVPPPYAAVLNFITHGDEEALTRALGGYGLPRIPRT
jgi:hypothetical protein